MTEQKPKFIPELDGKEHWDLLFGDDRERQKFIDQLVNGKKDASTSEEEITNES